MTHWLRSVLVGCVLFGACTGPSTEYDVGIGQVLDVAVQSEITPAPVVAVASPVPSATSTPVATVATPRPIPTATPVSQRSKVNPDPSGVLPDEVAAGIPHGYQLLGHAIGDLNLDGRLDVAVIVHQPGDADFGTPLDLVPSRPVLLFLAEPSGTFTLAVRSDNVALCGRCGGTFGDPFVDLTIGPGTISIGHYGGSAWRWTNSPTFAYDIVEDDWVLTGVSQSSFHASDPDNTFEDHSISEVDPILFADYQSSW